MSNRILRVRVRDRSLDPAQAELWVAVEAEHVTPTTELRGRLTGPRCLYAATVEVAYPLRVGAQQLAGRIVIPEPCLWEPQCPFLYHGGVELWEDGLRCDRVEVRRGPRRVLLGAGGLRVNGQSLSLRGRVVTACDEAAMVEWRRSGVNLLLQSGEARPELWDLADRHGFFVLSRMVEAGPASLARAERETDHPACLGWLLAAPFDRWTSDFVRQLRSTRALVGVEFAERSAVPPPEGAAFIACPADAAAHLRTFGLPMLLTDGGLDAPGAFGHVE